MRSFINLHRIQLYYMPLIHIFPIILAIFFYSVHSVIYNYLLYLMPSNEAFSDVGVYIVKGHVMFPDTTSCQLKE